MDSLVLAFLGMVGANVVAPTTQDIWHWVVAWLKSRR